MTVKVKRNTKRTKKNLCWQNIESLLANNALSGEFIVWGKPGRMSAANTTAPNKTPEKTQQEDIVEINVTRGWWIRGKKHDNYLIVGVPLSCNFCNEDAKP